MSATYFRRSRRIVLTRAKSRRSVRSLAGASSWPIDFWIRRRNSWSSRSLTRAFRSSTPSSRISPIFMTPLLLTEPGRELRLDGQLGRGQLHGALGIGLAHAFHLEQDPAGTDHAHPFLGRALALAHSGFERLLRDRLVGEHAHPDLAAALDEARHRHAGRLDLTGGHPARLHRLQPVVSERDIRAPPRFSGHATALLLAVLDLLRHQHRRVPCPLPKPWRARGRGDAARGRDTLPRGRRAAPAARPCRATPSRRSGRTSCWPRRIHSRCPRAASAAAA